MNRSHYLVPLLFIAVPVFGGGDTPTPGKEIRLEVGASVVIEEEGGPRITFREVVSDNRCPRGVQCIVAGEGVVRIDVEHGESLEELTFEIPPGGSDTAEALGCRVEVLRLLPEPRAGQRLDPEEYVVELQVVR